MTDTPHITPTPEQAEERARQLVKPQAEAVFAEWFYPGPDTIIHKPDWHSPKIFRAAINSAMETGNLTALIEAQAALIEVQAAELAELRAADRAQVEIIEKQAETIIRINGRNEALTVELETCRKYRDAYAECDRIGTKAVRELEAARDAAAEALSKAKWLLTDAIIK